MGQVQWTGDRTQAVRHMADGVFSGMIMAKTVNQPS